MNVAIVHTAVSAESRPDESDVLDQVEAVSGPLESLGHTVQAIPCDLDLAGVKTRLVEIAPDAVFNLVESLGGYMRLIHVFPALLEALALPYTGSCAEALWVTTHKGMAKARMAENGLPTPPWLVPDEETEKWGSRVPLSDADAVKNSWILKSQWEHASVGLDEGRIVSVGSIEELSGCLKRLSAETGDACFAEAYIDGREFNLSVLGGPQGPRVLCPAEIVFEGFGEEKPKIVGYRAKWDPASWEYAHTPRRFDFHQKDRELLSRMEALALSCWKLFGLAGYARVDFRVDSKDRPWILEVNANPCLSPDAGFAAALERSGIPFSEAVERILHDAFHAGRIR